MINEFIDITRIVHKAYRVYFLCKETEQILPYFSQENNFDIQKEIQNTALKNITNSNDRSGYLIYQAKNKVCM